MNPQIPQDPQSAGYPQSSPNTNDQPQMQSQAYPQQQWPQAQQQNDPAMWQNNHSTSEDTLFQTFIPTKNMFALVGYYVSLFSFIPFIGFPLSIAGIVLGVMGLKQHKVTPTPGAKGHALFACIFGGIMLLLHVGFTIVGFIA